MQPLAVVAKLVGMRPLEKSLEKLDDVRKKKLSEMIGGSGAGSVGSISVTVQTSSGSISFAAASEGSFVKKSAPASKKGGAIKSGVNKKGDAVGQLKTSKPAEPKDVEVL
ncbi:protein MOR1-like isoform X2 [Camellia sinensis]|uniref:protein MOR1-like isoform X2 n=1 Tax=Camellia sinensis TaxID=4442 RepID=UPI0010365128|nr:protein MOR1-like isoform X2 [Camellia sinensis]